MDNKAEKIRIIDSITRRIDSEYSKHKGSEWSRIAANKIYSEWLASLPLPANLEELSYQNIKLTDEEITDIAFDYGYGMDIGSDKITTESHVAYCKGLEKGSEKMWLKLYPHLSNDAEEVKELRAEIEKLKTEIESWAEDSNTLSNKLSGYSKFCIKTFGGHGSDFLETKVTELQDELSTHKEEIDNLNEKLNDSESTVAALEKIVAELKEDKILISKNYDLDFNNLCNEISELKSKLSLQPVNEWVSVSDYKPKINYNSPEQVIVFTGKKFGATPACAIYLNGKFYNMEQYQSEEAIEDISTIDITNLVSHWMPLPNPPKTN